MFITNLTTSFVCYFPFLETPPIVKALKIIPFASPSHLFRISEKLFIHSLKSISVLLKLFNRLQNILSAPKIISFAPKYLNRARTFHSPNKHLLLESISIASRNHFIRPKYFNRPKKRFKHLNRRPDISVALKTFECP